MVLVLPIFAVLSTVPLSGDVTADGGDYVVVPFTVPAGTVEIQISHTDGAQEVILDWGVWAPEGARGWGGGLTDDAIIGVDESSRGYVEGPITPGTWQLVIGKAKLALGMGHYDVVVTCRDDATLTPLPRAAFTPVLLEAGARWYAGDFHVHSEESGDATATLDEIATLAKSRGLDFVAITDHNTISQHPRIAAFQATEPDLLLLRAAEITTYQGHGNAIGISSYVDHRVGLDGVTATTIIDDVVGQGGLFLINHPVLDVGDSCIGCAWEHPDPWTNVGGLEVLTGAYTLTVNFLPQIRQLWATQLRTLLHLAAVGGSDDHRAGADTGGAPSIIGSPTTLVYATELSEAGIIAGVRAGHTMVKLRGPDDPDLELSIGTSLPGDVFYESEDGTSLHARVVGGDGAELKVYQHIFMSSVATEPEVIASAVVVGADWTADFPLEATFHEGYVRVELEVGGQPAVIASPFYVGPLQYGDLKTGCCSTGRGAPGGWPVPLALALVLFRCRRRRR